MCSTPQPQSLASGTFQALDDVNTLKMCVLLYLYCRKLKRKLWRCSQSVDYGMGSDLTQSRKACLKKKKTESLCLHLKFTQSAEFN